MLKFADFDCINTHCCWLAPLTTLMLESWPTKANRSPFAEKETPWTHPPIKKISRNISKISYPVNFNNEKDFNLSIKYLMKYSGNLALIHFLVYQLFPVNSMTISFTLKNGFLCVKVELKSFTDLHNTMTRPSDQTYFCIYLLHWKPQTCSLQKAFWPPSRLLLVCFQFPWYKQRRSYIKKKKELWKLNY